MILVKGDQEFWKVSLNLRHFDIKKVTSLPFLLTTSSIYPQLLEQDIFVSAFFELTAQVVCEPSTVGFNLADVEVMKNLPEVCVPLLKALLASPYRTHLESSLLRKISRTRYVNHL